MKIYTSYFAKIKQLPETIQPISISLFTPKGVGIPLYTALAPNRDILQEYKMIGLQDRYVKRYNDEVLKTLDKEKVLQDLEKLSDGKDIALCCYEKSEDFCHRHLAAKWLDEDITEWKADN